VLSALSRDNAERNAACQTHAACFVLTLQRGVAFAAAGLDLGLADHVLMNPPFNAPQNPSPDAGRRLAHNASHDTADTVAAHGNAAASPRRRGHADLACGRPWRRAGGADSRVRRGPRCCQFIQSRAGPRSRVLVRAVKTGTGRLRCCRVLYSPMPTACQSRHPKPYCATVPP